MGDKVSLTIGFTAIENSCLVTVLTQSHLSCFRLMMTYIVLSLDMVIYITHGYHTHLSPPQRMYTCAHSFAYQSVERTLCPLLNEPHETDSPEPSLVMVDISTSSPVPVNFTLRVTVVESFYLK